MYNLLGQVSYPVFIAGVFLFFILASIFSFIVGISLATRNARMLHFFDFMNKRISTRQLMKPLAAPHYVEPVLLKRPSLLGGGIVAGAIASILLLWELDAFVFQPIYTGAFSETTALILGGYTRAFLLIGNGLCIVVGGLLLFYPQKLHIIGHYTDKWMTFRRQTKPLNVPYFDTDKWILANATVAGITLSVVSLGLGIWMYMRL